MLIGFIKQNRSLAPVFLPLALGVLWIKAFFLPLPVQTGPIMPVYGYLNDFLAYSPALSALVGLLLLLAQSLLVNHIIERHEVLGNNSFLPGFVYALLMSSDPGLLYAHPALFSNLFLLLALNTLLQSYRMEKAYACIFDAGLYIALASLFYLPASLFLLIVWAALIILRPFIWREWVISILGFMVPWILLLFYFYWQGLSLQVPDSLLPFTWIKLFSFNPASFFQTLGEIAVAVVLFLTSLLSVGRFLSDLSSGTVRTRSNLLVILNFFIISLIAGLFSAESQLSTISFIAIPAAFYFSGYFLFARKKAWPEVLLLLLIISIFINQYIL